MKGIPELFIYARSKDIRVHFKSRSLINPTLAKLVPKIPGVDIESQIVKKADGVFLLADLHITNLATQTNTAQLIRALDSLPSEATTIYEQTLHRISQQDENKKKLAFLVLSWIFHALRPLTLPELQHLLAITRLQRMPDEADLDEEEFITSSCAGLVTITRSARHWTAYEEQVIFVHYTVQEYLEQVRTNSNFLSEIAAATTCMKVISFPTIRLICCFRMGRPRSPIWKP